MSEMKVTASPQPFTSGDRAKAAGEKPLSVEVLKGLNKPQATEQSNQIKDVFESGNTQGAKEAGLNNGKQYQFSSNGTPCYSKEDISLGNKMGSDKSSDRLGTGTSAAAMALSKISGQLIEPDQVLEKLGSNSKVDFNKAAGMVGMQAHSSDNMDWSAMDKELAAGRPVVLGGDFNDNGDSDYYVTVTRREGTTYFANDPLTGKEMKMTENDSNRLEGKTADGKTLTAGNELIRFSGGNPNPGNTPPSRPYGQ
ncbi:MAG: hypothetical protein FWG75_06610 [Cystobacterineae bacterium]|nr:hypothetical protein [Cystobacterineae bacterium]